MLTYFTESEEIKMDVQVGPQEEVEVKAEDKCCDNPIEEAKKKAENVPIACQLNKETGLKEFYVDAADVAKLANLNEMTMLEALNEIIDVNEASEISADNIVVVMSEGTEMYERNLERNGAACVHFNEAGVDDVEMDVQVGPNEEEVKVSEDPQEANPVDAVKRQYDSVVVAKQGDKFFMDVEDVQKCAELKCESVIDTINGIIDINESHDMNTENTVFIASNGMTASTYEELCEAGAIVVFEAANPEAARRKKMIKDMGRLLRSFLVDQGCMRIDISSFYIGGENKAFVDGEGRTILLGISSKAKNKSALIQAANGGSYYSSGSDEDAALAGIEAGIKCIKDHKDELIAEIEDKFEGYKVSSIKSQIGRLGVTNVAITFEKPESKKDDEE